MNSPCIRQVSQACIHGCCPAPLLCLIDSGAETSSRSQAGGGSYHLDFAIATASSLYPHTHFTNHESLPSLPESFSNFNRAFPLYIHTHQADQIRTKHYHHLSVSGHVCFDYIGHGLFSYSQLQHQSSTSSVAATSSSSSPPRNSHMDFDISYKSVNFNAHILEGTQESEVGSKMKKRIMEFMNISEDDYTMVFTANQSSAFKIVADSYPFHTNPNLLTVYDYKSEAVGLMIESSKRRGARVMSAEFSRPNRQIQTEKLRKKIVGNRKKRKKGVFVFPLQSRMSGTRYSYLWMSLARENGWHVLLDACALGAKDMETLGLSLFKPDFVICSFFRVFGENPSGFGCLFVKKSSASIFTHTITAGIVQLIPLPTPDELALPCPFSDPLGQKKDDELIQGKQEAASTSEITECPETKRVECKGLDDADRLGLIVISSRARCLINWLVNAMMSLKHPNSGTHLPLVKIYGPKIKFDRGPALAFNVLDWKGEKIDPPLVQKLADRNNISVGFGFLEHINMSNKKDNDGGEGGGGGEEEEEAKETEKQEEEEEERSGRRVVTAALGFLTNFEDVYRLWAFIARFLDADFVEKERWRYKALNQNKIEI